MRGWLWIVVLLAGCPGAPTAHLPTAPLIAPVPTVSPVPWWQSGDAACPPLAVATAGPVPGQTQQPGQLRRTPTDVHCEAGGVAHGPATRLYPDGKPAASGMYDRGRLVGTWATWFADGAIASYGAYAEGTPAGLWSTWYPSHRPHQRGERAGESRRGLWVEWDDRATSVDPDRFVEYTQDGEVARDGGFPMRGTYRDGKPIQMLPVCIVGFAYPGCRLVPILDAGVRFDPTEGTPAQGKKGSALFETGLLVNLDDHNGVGVAGGVLVDATYPGLTLEGRYRYWLQPFVAVEGGLGLIRKRGDRPGVGDGIELHVAFVLADFVSLTATLEHRSLDAGASGDATIGLVGLRFGLPTLLGALDLAAHLGGGH